MININTLDSKIISNVSFEINPCVEFTCAVGVSVKYEEYSSLASEMNFKIYDEDKEIFEKFKSNISRYITSELKYFYNICSVENILMAYITDFNNIENVELLLDAMDKTDEITLVSHLGGIFISEYVSENHEEWCSVRQDLSKMLEFIENSRTDKEERKERLLECFRNPEETKQRLCFMFRQLYEKAYKPVEGIVLERLREAEKKYKSIFEEDPQGFLKRYFIDFFKPEKGKWEYKIGIHISLFYQISFWPINLHDYKKARGMAVLGMRSYEFYSKKELNDKVNKFLKALSDSRRLSIIRLLAARPYYGYEIAAALNLTPATVNYHMNFLLNSDIVSFDKEETKVYFILNKDRFKELFKESEKMLLNE